MTTIDIRQQLALLSPERRRLVELLLRQEQQAAELQTIPIPRQPDRTNAPLSFSQQRLWFLDQWEPGTPAYNLPQAIRLTGWLSVSTLARSLNTIVQRHESLRTTFATVAERPVQVVAPMLRLPLPMVDLQGLPAPAREAEVQRLSTNEARYSFDLAGGPLLRAALLRLGAREHLLLLNMHHIISDRWSMGVFVRELLALYEAYAHGRPLPLSALPIQYPDFAIWQRQQLQGPVLQGHMDYWRAQLAELPPLLTLPTDRPRPPIQTFRGAAQAIPLPGPLVRSLGALSQHEGSTLFMTLLAAFKLLLARYAAQDDISVGTFIANRTREELEPLIGFFVNTLVLRTDLAGNPTFRELLRRVRETALGAYAHQDVPFEMLLEELHPSRVLNRTPMFQVMLVLQNTPRPRIELPNLTIDILARPPSSRSNFDLTLWITEQPDGLLCNWEYSTDLFDATTIERMQQHFQIVLEAIVADPDQRLLDLPLVSANEQRRLLWSVASDPAERAIAGIHRLFEAQVEQTPDAIALGCEDTQLSYRELNARANRLARHLRGLGVGPEVRVGVCVERGAALIVGLLAVLKAGGAYVPLDPVYASERLQHMLADSQAQVLITGTDDRQPVTNHRRPMIDKRGLKIADSSLDEDLSPSSILYPLSITGDRGPWSVVGGPRAVLNMRADWPDIARQSGENLPDGPVAQNLAYVIYTSGSTGRPKGVMVTQGSLTNAYQGWERAYALRSVPDCHLQMASVSFDVFTGDLVRALCSGGRLVLCPREVLTVPEGLYALIEREQVTCAEFVPSVARLLSAYLHQAGRTLRHMRLLVVGSESWSAREHGDLGRACGPATRLINSYGVTEATIDSTYFDTALPDESGHELVPIGQPFANVGTYLLNARMQAVPIGVIGELYITGAGLARGYLGRPDLTAERFVPDPTTDDRRPRIEDRGLKIEDSNLDQDKRRSSILYPLSSTQDGGRWSAVGRRLYKTGDLARYRPDGTLEFVGRGDHQIKLRGYRIEVGEIEAALADCSALREAAVLAREDVPGDTRLVAYVVPAETLNDERRTMNASEPSYSSSIVYHPSSVVDALRSFLKQRLPDYMVPSAFVPLEALPRTPNGKLDRRALPKPNHAVQTAQPHAEPRTLAEQRLAEIWASVLGVAQVSVYDNFFDMGGHSLLMAQFMFQLRDTFQVNPPLRILFEQPTLMELALLIEEMLVQEIEALSEEEAQLMVMWASN